MAISCSSQSKSQADANAYCVVLELFALVEQYCSDPLYPLADGSKMALSWEIAMVDLNVLRVPFALHEHQWRVQSVARSGRSAHALCYINARAVQSRLDDACGVAGWESSFTETASGRVIATISIDMNGRWVSKSDGAGSTAMEGEKGGISDAFKRAAVMWGIGRYLYSIPTTWAECDVIRDDQGQPRLRNNKPVWKRWTARGQDELNHALRSAMEGFEPVPPAIVVQRPALLPAPAEPDAALADFIAAATPAGDAHWPEEVTEILKGLPGAVRDGSSIQFWGEKFRLVPREWRAFVISERDRIKRDFR